MPNYKIPLKPGTKIRRTLKGKDHIVTVKDADTFIYDGKEFKNLSAVASCICGKRYQEIISSDCITNEQKRC